MRVEVRKEYVAMAVVAVCLSVAPGCSAPPRQPAVPQALQSKAIVPGMPGVRYRAGRLPELIQDAKESFEREKAYLASQGQTGPLPPSIFLAISGGGDNGAFGAGVLNGW